MTDSKGEPLLELFRSELREQLAVIRAALDQLAQHSGDAESLEALAAALHTIAGAARLVGFTRIAAMCAALEACCARAVAAGTVVSLGDAQLVAQAAELLGPLMEVDPEAWRAAHDASMDELLRHLESPRSENGSSSTQPPVTSASPASVATLPWIEPEMLELFREEARSHAATLSAGLLELEQEPSSPTRIEPLMRAAHSLKGASRIVGVDAAVELAHHMEDVLAAAQAGKIHIVPVDIDLLLRGTDLLAAMGHGELSEWLTVHREQLAELIPAMRALAQGVGAPAVVPPVPVAKAEVALAVSPGADVAARSAVVAGSAANVPSPAVVAEAAESVVRVTAQSLNRLMNLAGESLVQARWLQPFARSLQQLKVQQDALAVTLEQLSEQFIEHPPSEGVRSSVAATRDTLTRSRQELAKRIGEFETHAARAEDLNTRLYREVIASRMRPFADGAHAFPRLVRDTARQLGKDARLELLGADVPVDRDVLERLEAPLTHLLRNAVDHGLESPEAREAAGKPRQGLVRLEARHLGGMLAITVSDDGRGIDVERLRARVVQRQHTTAEIAARLSEAELLEFLFLPGFTTTNQVTEVSGRGVGLDVVQTALRKIGGSVQVVTGPERGTSFHLQLPLTLSVLRAVLVDIAGEPYAFPHTRIERLIRVERKELQSLEHRHFVGVDGKQVGLVVASQLLEMDCPPPADETLCVLLLSDNTGTYGLIVDAFLGEEDLVVRPLDARLGRVPNISAAAVLDDGSPVLIADAEDLVRAMDQFIQSGTLRRCDADATRVKRSKRVLVVDDSITVREVQRQILRAKGYDVAVAVDGQDGWHQLREGAFDLVISDIDMPRMSGLELVRRIREDAALRSIPVVVVSYKDRDEDRLRGLEVGANQYLTKSSFHDHTFLEAVTSLIGDA